MNIKPFFSFEGKSTRSEYWGVNLVSYFVLMVAVLLTVVLSMAGVLGAIMGAIIMIGTAIASVWVVLAVTAKRCRDIGINPMFTAALFIPYIAIIPFIVFGCLKSEVKND